jgi:two-component system chemotaxis sensor kinase CheA
MGRLIEEIRNGTLQLRMVPIGETFSALPPRRARHRRRAGQGGRLEIVGGDTELDKSVVEKIADPLMHLVRNALDHGLERPTARGRRQAAQQGTLTLPRGTSPAAS